MTSFVESSEVQSTVGTSFSELERPSRPDAATGPASDRSKYGLVVAAMLLSAVSTVGGCSIEPFEVRTGRRREDVLAESSTVAPAYSEELSNEVRALFDHGADEFFQDGMHSAFSLRLVALVGRNGASALRAISEYLFNGGARPSVVSEALRWLPDIKRAEPTELSELWRLLQRATADPSSKVRDGAILGFAALDDPRARTLLSEARDKERVLELRRLIEQVLEQLNATADATAATNGPGESLA